MPADKRTILSLVNINPKKLGSLEMILIVLSRRLAERGSRSVIVFSKDVPDELKDNYEGITVDTLSGSGSKIHFYRQLIRIMFKYRPDIVHVGFYPIFSPMTFLICLCGCRSIIFTDHISGEISKPKGIKKHLIFLRNRFLIQFVKKFICISDYVLDRDKAIPGIDPAKLSLLYYGVDLKRFYPHPDTTAIRQALNIPEGAFVICTVANLIREKGIDYLIRAMKTVTDKRNDIILLIAGEGKNENELKMLTRELGLEDKVKFIGLRSDSERVFSASDIFVCPSVWQEAFGLTNTEAMACGLPVVATKVGGIPEIIDDGVTGILIEPKDTQGIVNAIEQLYNNPDICKKMGQRSKEMVKEHFDLERMTSDTINIYENISR